MYMKIEYNDDKLILYLRDIYINNQEEIKKIFIKLINNYHIKLFGLYDVLGYENKKYGTILEITKKDNLYNSDIIDLKIKLIKNKIFYFKTLDYFIISNLNNIYYDDNYYYIDINNIDNINKIIEYGTIIYNKKDNYLNNKLLIK